MKQERLKRFVYILIILLLPVGMCAKKRVSLSSSDWETRMADSLMSRVIFFAPMYEEAVGAYKAEIYVKGRINIRKQNFLLRFWPSIFRLRKGVREYMMEAYGDLNYTSPDHYDHRIRSVAGTTSEFWQMDHRLPEYFHINVYSSSLLGDKLISPLSPNAHKYYKFRVDSIWGPDYQREYKIRFMPRSKSFQLVGGYFVVTENVWSIREMRFAGRSEWFAATVLLRI